MKLSEIPDLLTKKIRRRTWNSKQYIYFNGAYWAGNWGDTGGAYPMSQYDYDYDNWETCEDPKPKKKYWLWAVKFKSCAGSYWAITTEYMDEQGLTTSGISYYTWENYEKIKHENIFIEV